jgi:calcium permeable stress-gated cation channel
MSPIILFFTSLSLMLLYCAHRYNILFVYDTGVDMTGSAYPTALEQLFVGLYIAELCLVGLVATQIGSSKAALGPFVLLILLVGFTAVYHVGLNITLKPLIKYLPKTLEADTREEAAARLEGASDGIAPVREQHAESDKGDVAVEVAEGDIGDKRKPNMVVRFFKPHIYDDYSAMRRLVETRELVQLADEVDEGLVRDAYLQPAVWAQLPHLLIPRDEMGISAQECRLTGEILRCSDDTARLDDKNRIVVDDEAMRKVLFAEKTERIKEY